MIYMSPIFSRGSACKIPEFRGNDGAETECAESAKRAVSSDADEPCRFEPSVGEIGRIWSMALIVLSIQPRCWSVNGSIRTSLLRSLWLCEKAG